MATTAQTTEAVINVPYVCNEALGQPDFLDLSALIQRPTIIIMATQTIRVHRAVEKKSGKAGTTVPANVAPHINKAVLNELPPSHSPAPILIVEATASPRTGPTIWWGFLWSRIITTPKTEIIPSKAPKIIVLISFRWDIKSQIQIHRLQFFNGFSLFSWSLSYQ